MFLCFCFVFVLLFMILQHFMTLYCFEWFSMVSNYFCCLVCLQLYFYSFALFYVLLFMVWCWYSFESTSLETIRSERQFFNALKLTLTVPLFSRICVTLCLMSPKMTPKLTKMRCFKKVVFL